MIIDISIFNIDDIKKIVIIGDVHGDIKRLKDILFNEGIINNNIEWIAEPNTIVIQLGDQIDSINRSPEIGEWEKISDIHLLYFTRNLERLARVKNCEFISLIGNHELMNIIGNFEYVSDISNFKDRHTLFKPITGSIGNILAYRPLVAKIGKYIFCHAGIRKIHLDILDKYGKDIFYLNEIWKMFMLTNNVYFEDKEIFEKIILGDNGILWTRNYDNEDDIEYIFRRLNCKYMFIGHTTVDKIECINNRIYFTDNFISRSFGKNTYQYVVITDDKITTPTISE